MDITEDQAYIAVRTDGFVDGACFTDSEDAQCWCKEMRSAGLAILVCDRREAKAVLFTHIIPPFKAVAYGLPIGLYHDHPIPGWIMTADGRRLDYDGACGPRPDFEALPPGCYVIAPGLMYRAQT